jgi:hypothetical protein
MRKSDAIAIQVDGQGRLIPPEEVMLLYYEIIPGSYSFGNV